jgi:hypothetical protein
MQKSKLYQTWQRGSNWLELQAARLLLNLHQYRPVVSLGIFCEAPPTPEKKD